MKLIRSLAPLCALLLPCALTAETFEGKVTMSMTSSASKDGPQTVNYSIREGMMRMDVMTAKGGGGFITDFKNRQMIILMPQQKMYMVRAMPDTPTTPPAAAGAPGAAHAAANGESSFRDTGEKETILGYVCEKYEVRSAKGSTADIWATDKLGMFGGLTMGGGPGRRSQAPQEWENVIKGSGFFPLRVTGTDGGGKTFKLEVTSVSKESLPDSVFTPPSDWRKFDLGAMMGGAFPGGFPGARPADGNN
jgi:hypothetical protein